MYIELGLIKSMCYLSSVTFSLDCYVSWFKLEPKNGTNVLVGPFRLLKKRP